MKLESLELRNLGKWPARLEDRLLRGVTHMPRLVRVLGGAYAGGREVGAGGVCGVACTGVFGLLQKRLSFSGYLGTCPAKLRPNRSMEFGRYLGTSIPRYTEILQEYPGRYIPRH